ncbi:MAG: hypothetical protein NVS1B4_01660 [Gemmatimonadaceae bacterium]
MSVTNAGREPLHFRFYVGDFDQAENGEHSFGSAGTHPQSCGARLHVQPEGATVFPGQRQEIRLDMVAGPATCWSMVFAESRVRSDRGVLIGQRIGAKVYGVSPSATRDGEVSNVRVTGTDNRAVSFEFRARGTAPLRPRGRVEIRKTSGETVATADVESFNTLPGHTRRVVVPIRQPLSSGEYVAVPVLDLEAEFLAGGQALFKVP